MTWRAITKAASGAVFAVPAECTCRSAAHCHSTRQRQLEPSVGIALHAAVRRCVASGQADELPVKAKMAGRPSALRSRARASLSSKDGARHKRQEACDVMCHSPIERATVIARIAFGTQAGQQSSRQPWTPRDGQRLNANTKTPALTIRMPAHSRMEGRSSRKATANTVTSSTLSLSTGATLDASPIFKARK